MNRCDRIEHSARAFQIVWDWLRPYQRALLLDRSRYRAILKSRRVGISDFIALEMVLTSSGLGEALGLFPHNCNVISKTQTDARGVIKYAKKWVRILSKVPAFKPFWPLLGSSWFFLRHVSDNSGCGHLHV